MIIKKTKELKSFNFINKIYHINEQISSVSRKKNKKIKIKVKARENKVYRKGTIDGLLVVGIDGTESFGSYKKNWNNSYKNTIKTKKL